MESFGGASAPGAAMAIAFARQREACAREPNPARSTRDGWLAALRALVKKHGEELAAAVSEDFGHRSVHETRLLEVFPSLEAIKHARRHLRRWMRRERRTVSLWFQPGRAYVEPQPLGVVGIVVPWNYPIYLALGPMVGALAAGNRVLVKMSEFTPRTSRLFATLVAHHFAAEDAAVIEGDASVGQDFARLPFDHLLFTGSTQVGRSIMRAAAENLTPVTLELGGKSPALVAPGYPIEHAAERIVIGKCLNAGQTCIAPDYVLLPTGQESNFLAAARQVVDRCYPNLGQTADYTTIASDRHFARLRAYVNEAQARGARIVPLSATTDAADAATRRMPPVALLGVAEDAAVMREEIFGPLLPIVTYDDLDEAVRYINARPRPLAFYYFDHDRRRIDHVLKYTWAGGVTLNDTILHIAQDSLPFGGVGESGLGHYHGRAGFATFSKVKPVFVQSRINAMSLFKPPYGRLFDNLVRLLTH